MLSKFVVLGMVVLILILVAYLLHDSKLLKSVKKNDLPDKVRKINQVKILNGPMIYYKCPGDREYHQIQMTNKIIKIGRSAKNDIILDDESVEEVQASIEKKIVDNKVYYEFVDLSKYNPVEYFNQAKHIYEYVGFKRGVILDANEAFYIGETKLIVKCPHKEHKTSSSMRYILDQNEKSYEKRSEKYRDAFYEKKPEQHREPAYEKKPEQHREAFYEKLSEECREASFERLDDSAKREPSIRVVSRNEIDI